MATTQVPKPSYLLETDVTIRNRMLLYPDLAGVDRRQGSFIWDAVAPCSVEIARILAYCDRSLDLWFLQTATGVWLEYRAAEYGLERDPASVASGAVFTTGTVVGAGTQVRNRTAQNIQARVFALTEDATVSAGGTATTPVVALTPGVGGNIPSGSIVGFVSTPSGITGVSNPEDFLGGADVEDDDSLRIRALEAAGAESEPGNAFDYVTWARKATAGIGIVTVENNWNGLGTVRVVVQAREGVFPSDTQVADVQAYIDPTQDGMGRGKAPYNVIATVVGPQPFQVTMQVVGLISGEGRTLTETQDNILDAVTAYFEQLASGSPIRVKDVSAVIAFSGGVVDFAKVLLNGAEVNIVLEPDQQPVLYLLTYA